MDRQSVFTSRVFDTPADSEDSNTHVRGLLESFILDFRLENIYIYRSASTEQPGYRLSGTLTPSRFRDQIRENALLKKYYCDVNIGDLIKFNEEIAHRLVTEPAELIPLV